MGNEQKVWMETVSLCGCHGNRDETGQCECHQPSRVSADAKRGNRQTGPIAPLGSSASGHHIPSSKVALEGHADRYGTEGGARRSGGTPWQF